MFVIFGATGDLTKRKLIPALYNLYSKKKHAGQIICLARKNYSNKEFILSLEIDTFIDKDEDITEFSALISYHSTNFNYPDIDRIKKIIGSDEELIFYLAVGPALFQPLISIIDKLEISRKKVIFEKPFGTDLASAIELNNCIKKTFSEDEIYRIDHYLGKELVQNILVFRFANSIYEQIWNREFIDRVEIVISETLGVEQRAGYYDKSGALRDMMQNHMLQLLALTAMRPPVSMNTDDIRDRKVEVLRQVKIIDAEVAQYSTYRDEVNNPDSDTETYASVTVNVDNDKWRDVPFILRTGKKLAERYAEINLVMKDVTASLFSENKTCRNSPNIISLRIQPNEGIIIKFNAKLPGTGMNLKQVKMEFCHKCEFGPDTPEAYESLLNEILEGDQTLFTRWDGVETSWRLFDPLIKMKKKLSFYEPGSEVLK
jgi:glucose-6-phosphate 1-dehydrogenase